MSPPDQQLNTPPVLPPFPSVPGSAPGMAPPASGGPAPVSGSQMAPGQVDALIGSVTGDAPPRMEAAPLLTVQLPAGYIDRQGVLSTTAQVRELTGYDEEKLTRVDAFKNVAVYVTELLTLGVEEIGGQKPTKDVIQDLVIGDRDALILGVRRATYGDGVEFELDCTACGNKSEVTVELDKDIETKTLDDPTVRTFEVPLRAGTAKMCLLTGRSQEAFSDTISKKTTAEVTTLMLSKTVVEINGVPTNGREDSVRALSSRDRTTLKDFMNDHQPGPRFNEIPVNCATCRAEYPVSLGIGSLFRF